MSLDIKTAEKMHRQGSSLQEIADICEVVPSTVLRGLRRSGAYEGRKVPGGAAFDAHRGRAVIAMRDVSGMTFQEIGDLYGYTRQWAHRTHARALEVLSDEQAEGDASDTEAALRLVEQEIKRLTVARK